MPWRGPSTRSRPDEKVGVDPFQLCVCLGKFSRPFGDSLIQLLIGEVQFLVGRLQFFGQHGGFLQCRPQFARRILVPQRVGHQCGHFCRMLPGALLDLAPKPILFPGQCLDFPVRVFKRDVRLFEFLSQSRDFVAKGLFLAVRPFHML